MRYAEGAESHDSDSPEKTLIQRQLGAAIQRALVRLSPEKQQTFLLREYHEHSSFETARMIAAPEATVRTRVHHARRMLRQALTNDGYESAA
jgi:RNA polymerase sigma-70 factor (ECF subfamily)